MTTENTDLILEKLNDSQRKAVSAPLQNMLVIAGAGTGKTRVLVSRIAWLLQHEALPARSILAVTFTNKAAKEMKDRLEKMSSSEMARGLWCNTFHALCLRMLRAYAGYAGLTSNFTVIDTENQKNLIKRIMKQFTGLSSFDGVKPNQVVSKISLLKERGKRAQDCTSLSSSYDPVDKAVGKIYPIYEATCNAENIVDFSELLLRMVELLEKNEDVRKLQHHRFKEILVDEFQDTDSIQYKLLTLLCGPDSHVMVVGDDDQSIYGWRGADFSNMRKFLKDFPNVEKIKLEDNYRSSQSILDIANILISRNENRLMEKVLRGNHGAGEPVRVIENSYGDNEAVEVVDRIKSLHDKEGVPYEDIAILYRNNNLSLSFETQLGIAHIPCTIYGGQKFFERAEVLDALAYLRVLINDRDDTALSRIINVPARKIGPKVVTQLTEIARERGCSLMQALSSIVEYGKSPDCTKEIKTLAKKLGVFHDLIEAMKKKLSSSDCKLSEFVKFLIAETGLYDFYRQKDEKDNLSGNLRHLNLEELVNTATSFENQIPSESEPEAQDSAEGKLLDFISSTSLASTTELNSEGMDVMSNDKVNLMTIHAAKGLEFKVVFLVGFEEQILPSPRSSLRGAGHALEEERRLAYVGVTRAKEKLYISYASARTIYGMPTLTGMSQFLREIIRAANTRENTNIMFIKSNRY